MQLQKSYGSCVLLSSHEYVEINYIDLRII